MNFEQIQQLIAAGFTPDQIMQLQGGISAQPAPAQPEPTQPAQPDPEPAQPEPTQTAAQVATQPAASSQAQQTDDPYTRLEAKLNQLIGLQQMQNINASIPAGQQNQRSVADILGEVIAPPRKDINKK